MHPAGVVAGIALAGAAPNHAAHPYMPAAPSARYAHADPSRRFAAWNPQTQRFTNQRPANDPWLTAIIGAGMKFWQDRNVRVPPTTSVDVADGLQVNDSDPSTAAPARGYQPSADPNGRLVFDGNWLGTELAVARNPKRSVADRRDALRNIATVAFHELGHVGGLEHTASGVMSGTDPYSTEPYDARVLVNRLVPAVTPKRVVVRRRR